ncbi:DUF3386 domain-containing protein [Leptolyngbya sp. FACHB-261]|nr:DUF3386 domain-containing protein [Leptolyngbya sp. FACHB-261]
MLTVQRHLQPRLLRWSLSLLLATSLWFGGLFGGLCGGLPAAWAQLPVEIPESATPTAAQDTSARDLFRAAYENRYTWDEQFPGYKAEVSLKYGQALFHGLVQVNPDLSVLVTNIENDTVRQLVTEQLQMEAIHRRRVPFETLHGEHSFQLENAGDSKTVEIREIGDPANARYKLQGTEIAQVNRVMGQVAVTVDTLGSIQTPEGYLVTHYQSNFRDVKTDVPLGEDDVQDFYEKVGQYYLLTNRTIRRSEASQTASSSRPSSQNDILIRFNDIQPLSETRA